MPPGTGDVALTCFSPSLDGHRRRGLPPGSGEHGGGEGGEDGGDDGCAHSWAWCENMSYLLCPDCGRRSPSSARAGPRPRGGHGLKLLSRMPIDPALARLADQGRIETSRASAEPGVEEILALDRPQPRRPPLRSGRGGAPLVKKSGFAAFFSKVHSALRLAVRLQRIQLDARFGQRCFPTYTPSEKQSKFIRACGRETPAEGFPDAPRRPPLPVRERGLCLFPARSGTFLPILLAHRRGLVHNVPERQKSR